MKLIDSTKETVSIELKHEEFNFFREAARELPRALYEQELPTLTGYTKEQVNALADMLRDIAEEINLDL